jgi:hypothetical protein
MAVMNSASLRGAIDSADSTSTSKTTAGTDTSPIILPDQSNSPVLTVDINGRERLARDQIQQPNPLHDYDSYTYCLSLHLLNIYEYNALINNPTQSYYPQHVLVSSAGRYNTAFVRDPAFREDFYFDNLKMNTIVNVTNRSRSSNIVECNFTLIEPLGFTFINRLIDAAQRVNPGQGNYLLMPYVLQIDFFGYKDGELVLNQQPVLGGQVAPGPLSDLTKIIPINLTELKSKVTSKGTEYQISAVAYNHQAFNQVYVTSPAVFKVSAKTVQDVFGTGNAAKSTNVGTTLNQRADLIAERQNLLSIISDGNAGRGGFGLDTAQSRLDAINTQIASLSTVQASGFTDAMNRFWQTLRDSNATAGISEMYVQFHPDIANGQLYSSDAPINIAQATSGSNAKNNTQAAAGQNKEQIDFSSGTVSIPAGMNIDKLIDWAVRNSSYIRLQLNDPADSKAANALGLLKDNSANVTGPLKWYKIVPKIEIKEFDSKTNRYSLKITYYVNPWTLSAKHPYAPYGKVPGFVKEYQWLFSGKNKDVLDMQIDFDMLYYTQLQAARSKSALTNTAPEKADPDLITEGDGNSNTTATGENTAGGLRFKKVSPVPLHHVSSTYMQGVTGANPASSATAGDLQKSFTINAKGDMIMLKVRIIGDPHFIKQDDIFYRWEPNATSAPLTKNGSLWMDNGELYINVIFKTPGDYDETTGLAIPGNSPYSYSEFSGIYKLITVENEFVRGKFEQVLELAQISIEDTTNLTLINFGQRSVNLTLPTAIPRGFAATRFSGPSIIQNAVLSGIGSGASQLSGGGGGGGGGLLSSLTGQLQQAGGQVLNKAISDATKPLTDKVGAYAKDAFNKVKDALGFGGRGSVPLDQNGLPRDAGGAIPGDTPPNLDENGLPRDAGGATPGDEWNSESTDPIADAGGADPITFEDGPGIDGAVDVDVADLDLGSDIGGDFGGGDFGGGDFFG